MVCLLNPATWVGLLTLVVLEIVLSIDNLIFIAILVDKVPPEKRDQARFIGLGVSLTIRLILLTTISWIITLTTPIISNKYCTLSGHDLILLSGGLFLLFKATIELHEKLEGGIRHHKINKYYSGFWIIVFQIIIVDIIFSLDSVITAVGMVNKLFIMICAVIIATFLMFIAAKALTKFIHTHKTIVVLCLSFLLMIGLNLVSESFGVSIPKGYIYFAIGFSLFIEILNQISINNIIKYESLQPIRQRVTKIILRLIKKTCDVNQTKILKFKKINNKLYHTLPFYKDHFQDSEKYMIKSVLNLAERSIRSIMTHKEKIIWINTTHNINNIKNKLRNTSHSIFPICHNTLDNIIGIIQAHELFMHVHHKTFDIKQCSIQTLPITVLDTINPINLITVLRKSQGGVIIVTNKFGIIQGLITPLDILEAIAGEFTKIKKKYKLL
ncbi:hypothetical protein RJT54_01125 [Buchnera aphidicola (Takecallis taiwana)]|uniref:TerC family protein n=1 Tax=Buchnera aphidicola TaxID=9 RepID=UPI0031B674E0